MSLMALAAMSTMAIAGGDIAPVIEVTEPVAGLTGFYVGGGYSYIDTSLTIQDTIVDDGINAGTILAGYNLNEYLAFEGRYTFSADVDFDTNHAEIDGDIWSVFVKPQYPVSEDFKVYALLGYGETQLTDDGTFQYGLGGAYSATTNVEVFADWVRAYDDDEVNTVIGEYDLSQDVFTIGVNYKF